MSSKKITIEITKILWHCSNSSTFDNDGPFWIEIDYSVWPITNGKSNMITDTSMQKLPSNKDARCVRLGRMYECYNKEFIDKSSIPHFSVVY